MPPAEIQATSPRLRSYGWRGKTDLGAADVFEAVKDADGKRVLAGSYCRNAKVVVFNGGIADAVGRRNKNPLGAVQAILRVINCGGSLRGE